MLSRREIYESSLCACRYINVINMIYDQRGEIEGMVFKCVTIYGGGHYIIMYVYAVVFEGVGENDWLMNYFQP